MKQIKEFKPTDKFLPIKVFQFPLGNCGGITDNLTKESIYIYSPEGFISFSEIENKLLIFVEEQRSPDYWALKPLFQPIGLVGPMAGGNLAYSSDSRCKRIYHIHDRFESQETNNAMSK